MSQPNKKVRATNSWMESVYLGISSFFDSKAATCQRGTHLWTKPPENVGLAA